VPFHCHLFLKFLFQRYVVNRHIQRRQLACSHCQSKMILRSFGPQIDAKIHRRTSPIAVRMRLTAQNLQVENWRSVMRFEDQTAVLEWLPVDMKPARYDQPMEMARHRMNFESVTAAVKYATTTLPEGFRSNATIRIGNNVTLDWGDIERMSTG
jgi:hypothetical protein